MIRQDPSIVKRSNKAFANMSLDQIRQYADMLDKAADDPNILKEMEQLSSFNDKEKNLLTSIQEAVGGTRPMDKEWIESIVKSLKENPKFFKTLLKGKGSMMGGFTDVQMDSFFDMLSSLSSWFLVFLLSTIIYIQSLGKPAKELYNTVDKYTFGMAQYIVLALVLVIVYYCTRFGFYMFQLFLNYCIIPLYYFIKALIFGNGIKYTTSTTTTTSTTDTSNSKDEFAEF
jgi:hypothetical protein